MIEDGPYSRSSTKETKIRDPLIRYIHRVLSGSLCQGITVEQGCQLHRRHPNADIFGGWISKLFRHFIQRTPSSFNKGVGTTKVDLVVCRSMNLIIDFPGSTMCVKDARGRAWNPNNPNMILAIEDISNRSHPGQFPGSSSQGEADFPNIMNLYNIM
ncbi:hypothetical protein Hanom_Chr08g00749001 [Helianthus anomalus]